MECFIKYTPPAVSRRAFFLPATRSGTPQSFQCILLAPGRKDRGSGCVCFELNPCC